MKELIAAGGVINLADIRGETALHKATLWEVIDVMKELAATGADVELKNKEDLTAGSIDLALRNGEDSSISEEIRADCQFFK